MFQLDLLSLIPYSLKQTIRDVLVDFVVDQAKKYANDELATKIKKLRSDAAFNKTFEEGLQQAAQRFVEEYKVEDEDLVVAIAADRKFFKNEEIQNALLAVLRKPSAYLGDERDSLVQSFDTVLPQRLNRERVNRAVTYLLRCLAEELWHMPELQPVYSLQFQRITAEATREQVAIQKAQLQALTGLNAGIHEALLQLTDVIAEKKALPAGDQLVLPAPPKPKIYHNLPQPDYGNFVGRDKELAQVVNILRPYPRSQHALITIDGIGGIGKSALALEVAHRYLRNYDRIPPEERFEAIIWTSAKQAVLTAEGITARRQVLRTLDDIYTAIAVALQREDITRARPEEQTEVVRQALTRQRTLLIVDNLETVDDETVLIFLRELPAPTKAIVTTRHRLDVAYPVRLVGMPWGETQKLIAQECQKKGVSLSHDEARRLYDRTGGVPLAVVWSIAQIGFGYSIEAILTRLGHPTNDIARFCFKEAIEYLRNKPAYKLLMALSLFAIDTDREALGYVADLPELDRDEGLVELEKLSLINKRGERFAFLPLTKSFVTAELTSNPDLEDELGYRWIDYLRELCRGVESEYYWRFKSYRFYNEGVTLLEAVQWCYEKGSAEDVFILTLAAIDYLDNSGQWSKIQDLCQRVGNTARKSGKLNIAARLLVVEGWLLNQWGEYEEAKSKLQEALSQYQSVDSKEGESIVFHRLSSIYRKMGSYDQAKEACDNAWQIATELKDSGDLKALINTEYGKLARDIGDLELAWKYFSDVANWFEKRVEELPRDEDMASGTWGQLAIIAYRLGRPIEAKNLCLKSLEFYQSYGTKSYLPTLKYRLALAEEALGEYEAALQHVQEAMDWFERLGMKPDYAEAMPLLERLQRN